MYVYSRKKINYPIVLRGITSMHMIGAESSSVFNKGMELIHIFNTALLYCVLEVHIIKSVQERCTMQLIFLFHKTQNNIIIQL
jgi:hypothetical protein